MATKQSFLEYVSAQLDGLDVRFRPMMGEYVLYYREKVIGGLYDDAMAVKDTAAARKLLPDAEPQPPYPGAKGMLFVDGLDDCEFLARLFEAMWPELPAPKQRKRAGV